MLTSSRLISARRLPGSAALAVSSSTSGRIMAVMSDARTPCPMTSQMKTPAEVSVMGNTSKKSPASSAAGW